MAREIFQNIRTATSWAESSWVELSRVEAPHIVSHTHSATGEGVGGCCCWGVRCILISICIQGQKKAANGLIKISNYCQIEARFCPTRNESEMFHLALTHMSNSLSLPPLLHSPSPTMGECAKKPKWTNWSCSCSGGNWNFSRKWRRMRIVNKTCLNCDEERPVRYPNGLPRVHQL